MKSPLKPPPYLDIDGQPHKQGMIANDPPVCSRCVDEPSSLTKLEQHVGMPNKSWKSVKTPNGLLDGASERMSLTDPLNPAANKIGPPGHGRRLPPAWMALLPSNRSPASDSSGHSSPSAKTGTSSSQLKATSTPFTTPPQSPAYERKDQSFQAPSPLNQSDASIFKPSPSSNSIVPPKSHVAEGIVITLSPPKRLEVAVSRKSSASKPQDPPASTSGGSEASQAGSKNRIKRSFSVSRGIYAFRKPSHPKPESVTLEVCGPPESHTPMPSQDIAPAKTPFFKELSGFFSSRAKKGKLILPSRIGMDQDRSRNNECWTNTPDKSGFPRTCPRCGVDMSDWWTREECNPQSHEPGRRLDHQMCESCRAADTMPGTMPGGWD
jgi:hypothetical protein